MVCVCVQSHPFGCSGATAVFPLSASLLRRGEILLAFPDVVPAGGGLAGTRSLSALGARGQFKSNIKPNNVLTDTSLQYGQKQGQSCVLREALRHSSTCSIQA